MSITKEEADAIITDSVPVCQEDLEVIQAFIDKRLAGTASKVVLFIAYAHGKEHHGGMAVSCVHTDRLMSLNGQPIVGGINNSIRNKMMEVGISGTGI